MTFNERKKNLEYLLYLLEHNRLLSLDTIAYKFGCSKKTIHRMLDELRNEDYIIVYDRFNKNYFLEK